MEEAFKAILNNDQAFKEFSDEMFKNTDKDGNGLIDDSELEKALNEMTEVMKLPKPNKEFVTKMMEKYDLDKSGQLDHKEFESFSKYYLENLLASFTKD